MIKRKQNEFNKNISSSLYKLVNNYLKQNLLGVH